MDKFDGYAYVIGVWEDGKFVGYIPNDKVHKLFTNDISEARFYRTKANAQRRVTREKTWNKYGCKIFKVHINRLCVIIDEGKEMPFI